MIASEKFMKQFVEKHNVDCIIGSDEINAEKFFEWFDEVKEKSSHGIKIKEFDTIVPIIFCCSARKPCFFQKNMLLFQKI